MPLWPQSATMQGGQSQWEHEQEAGFRRAMASAERALRDIRMVVELQRADIGLTKAHIEALEAYLADREGYEYQPAPEPQEPTETWRWVRTLEGTSYRDHSTLLCILTREMMHFLAVARQDCLMWPPNVVRAKEMIIKDEVGEGRNNMVKRFLEDPSYQSFRWLMFWDDDVLPPADGLMRLLRWTEEHKVISGLYHTKGEPPQPLMYRKGKGQFGSEVTWATMLPGLDWIPEDPVEVDGCGMGFALIEREVLEAIEPPWFKTRCEITEEGGQLLGTEDLYFCAKLREALPLVKPLVDTSVRCDHLDVKTGIPW